MTVFLKTFVLAIALTSATSYTDSPSAKDVAAQDSAAQELAAQDSAAQDFVLKDLEVEDLTAEPLPLTKLLGPAAQQAAELISQDTTLLQSDHTAILGAIDNSLAYLRTPGSVSAYRDYAVPGITHDRVRRSLQRFRTLVARSNSVAELQQAVAVEFDFYQSIGHQSIGQEEAGTVAFTGYFEPNYQASFTPNETYRYPIYKRPATLDQWLEPHPTRSDLEGPDGLQSQRGPLKDLELVWLPSRLEAFLIQVQGSARLEMTDGSTFSVGYDGRTNYPYTSIGRALIDDGIIPADELTLPVLMEYFEQNPAALNSYIPRNNRFVFFRETNGAPATGSLGYPVTAGRSIATDKTVMPPGALALINLPLPQINRDRTEGAHQSGQLEDQITSRFVLDQDTGGAIKGAGRVDLFIGTGTEAGEIAGLINHTGALYYLLLKD